MFELAPGEQRSSIRVDQDWALGVRFLAGFDVRARGPLPQEPVTISRLVRTPGGETTIASFEIDATRGVTFNGATCVPVQDLRDWTRVEMRLRLTDRETGYFEVFCNRLPLWAATNTRTTFPPPCRRAEGCNGEISRPVDFSWQLGLMPNGPAASAMTLEMQRLHHRVLFYTPNRINAQGIGG